MCRSGYLLFHRHRIFTIQQFPGYVTPPFHRGLDRKRGFLIPGLCHRPLWPDWYRKYRRSRYGYRNGGPGAVFWMWAIDIFGSASAYIEATLGQIYKEVKDGQYRGGPSYYIEKGLGVKWYAILFAIVTILSTAFFLTGVQSNSISKSMQTAFNIPLEYTGLVLIILIFLIVAGGIKRISKFAEWVVPFMSIAYILVAFIMIAVNYDKVPEMFSLIIRSAFNLEPAFGGMIGSAIAWGVKRGIYSNEAGQGTAPHAASAAAVSHPAKQGLVQAFSVYVDTLLICTATAFMILITGKYNVYNPEGGYLVENLPGAEI